MGLSPSHEFVQFSHGYHYRQLLEALPLAQSLQSPSHNDLIILAVIGTKPVSLLFVAYMHSGRLWTLGTNQQQLIRLTIALRTRTQNPVWILHCRQSPPHKQSTSPLISVTRML